MKRQSVAALILLLLIPAVLMLGGFLFSMINPEIAAGHANYARNFYLLSRLRVALFFGSGAVAAVLWVLVFLLAIRSKERSPWWMLLAALGPLGLAILATLNDRVPAETDRHARFVQNLNRSQRVAYEVCRFAAIWLLAYQAMVLKRNLMILYESATTGASPAQIIATQNASSGMWAFGEGLEVMFLVVLFYLLWPIAFNCVGRLAAILRKAPSAAAEGRNEP
jgi:hypothetical protein